jgi:PncC family amidohydrolase
MSLQERLAAVLADRGLTLATAESCTGGGLSHVMTDVPGASAFFLGGIIAYHNDVKARLLGVDEETLRTHGAVSSETALAMAIGCRHRFDSDIAVSITGIAGPTGGSPEKPVGLVYMALATRQRTQVAEHHFSGNRAHVRAQAVSAAMTMILSTVAPKS